MIGPNLNAWLLRNTIILSQWRSHIGAIGAAAPVENFLVTFPIRPDPLSFFKRGGGVRGREPIAYCGQVQTTLIQDINAR